VQQKRGSISESVITGDTIDQNECIENTQALPQRVKACSVSGSALLSFGEEPCPLRLQTVFSTPILIFPETLPLDDRPFFVAWSHVLIYPMMSKTVS
jgi:hypothetical protein